MHWSIAKRVILVVCAAVAAGVAALVAALVWSYNDYSLAHMESRSRLFTELVSVEVSPGLYTRAPAAIEVKVGKFVDAARASALPRNSSLPRRLSLSSWTAACFRLTWAPSPVMASMSEGTWVGVWRSDAHTWLGGKAAATAAATELRMK